eukprot:TRINITY_DN34782_c0_g1_i1.p1 TRINITY_DN34782_c0_g1~~TRINITY_DN34782_c0_g1_i1.p1  ORF type:complete len:250 (+),score=54.05 TRINITY_DN34782_c0_g1_i1:42-791(+)
MTKGLSETGKQCSTYSEKIAEDERAYDNTTWKKSKEELHKGIDEVIRLEKQMEQLRLQKKTEQNRLPSNDLTTSTITVYNIPGEDVREPDILEKLELKRGFEDGDVKQTRWNGPHTVYLMFNTADAVENVMSKFGDNPFEEFKIERWYPTGPTRRPAGSTPSSTRSPLQTPQSDDSSSSATRRRPDIRALSNLVERTKKTNNYISIRNKQEDDAHRRLRREAEAAARAKEFPDSPPSLANDDGSIATKT